MSEIGTKAMWYENLGPGWWEPPQGYGKWTDTFEEAWGRSRSWGDRGVWRVSKARAYAMAREAQMASEMPLTVEEVRSVIRTAAVLDPSRYRDDI